MTADRNARIQERAYHLWLKEGRPHGKHEEHWHRAERELIGEESSLREASPITASRGGAEAIGAPEEAVEKAIPPGTDSRQDLVAPGPAGISRSGAKSQAPDHSKTNKPLEKNARPAAGSGFRGSRRRAAKPTA
jgi:hypothetical protein